MIIWILLAQLRLSVVTKEVAVAKKLGHSLLEVLKYIRSRSEAWMVIKLPKRGAETILHETEITASHRCTIWGIRTAVPRKLQQQMPRNIHETHQKHDRTISLARQIAGGWTLIKKLVKWYSDAAVAREQIPRGHLESVEMVVFPWKRIHAGFCAPIE